MDMPFGSVRQLGRSGNFGPHNLRFSAGTHVDLGRIQVSNRADYRAPADHGNRFLRLSASILAILIFLALGLWISKTLVAGQFGQTPTVRNLQLAAKLDPTNSEYHLRLSRLYEYNLTDIDPVRAEAQARRATQLNSYDPQAWLHLGATLEFQGKTAEAENCLRKADFLAPALPQIQWAAGNFFLLHGNINEAFRHFRVVLTGSNRFNQMLFETAWKASGDADKILSELIPDNIDTEFDYLNYLVARQRYAEAGKLWKRVVGASASFEPARAAYYVRTLIAARHASDAYEVWNSLRAKGVIPATYEQTRQNLIINGDFEQPILGMGFDWQLGQIEGAYISADETNFHSPSHSLLIQFSGKQNVDFQHLIQIAKVQAGRSYRLQGTMKTEGITTDSGPRLHVHDFYDPHALYQFSDDLKGNSMGWEPLMLDFKTPRNTTWIVVAVARVPSGKLDNLIAGKVWVDDITLTERPSQ